MSRVVTQFVLVCALTLTGMLCAGCDKGDEVQEKAMTMPAERFPDGRYHLDLLDKRAFDIAQVVEAHPDLVRIDAKNAEGTSSRWWKLEEGA